MQPSTVFAILSTILPFALADCCYGNKDNNNLCADGSAATPYCGNGKCNIFGCNCDGGCISGSAATAAMTGVDDDTDITAIFRAANVDGSGKLTLDQYTQYIGCSSEDAIYVDLFNEYDTNGDGVITVDEILE